MLTLTWAAIVALWLCPIALFFHALWSDAKPFSMVRGTLFMSTGLLVFFLPASYYQPRSFELFGRCYNRLGVRWFKRWVPDGDRAVRQARRFVPGYRVISGASGLSVFDSRTRRSEQGHLLWMWVTMPAILYAFVCGWAALALWLLVGNVIINLYPIMVQRYNRARIQSILARQRSNEPG